jgi:hypothetical protein
MTASATPSVAVVPPRDWQNRKGQSRPRNRDSAYPGMIVVYPVSTGAQGSCRQEAL